MGNCLRKYMVAGSVGIAVLALVSALVPPLRASTFSWIETERLVAGDAAPGDAFGYEVGLDGDTLAVGAFGDDSGQGAVYVFTRSGDAWAQQQKLVPTPRVSGARFGIWVAVDGDLLVAGADSDPANGYRSGAAYVFTRTDGAWSQEVRLLPSDGASGDWFGWNVAIQEETIFIGAPRKGAGAVYVFARVDGAWIEQQKLVASDGTAGAVFGLLAVDGDALVVGAPHDDENGAYSGSAYVFRKDQETNLWAQEAELTAPDAAAPGDRFGFSVSIDGDTLSVSALQDNTGTAPRGPGYVYVFVREGASWVPQQKLLASDGAPLDYFGYAHDLEGDRLLIGAYGVGDPNAGAAYVFERQDGAWTEVQALTPSDPGAGHFGSATAISSELLVVSAATGNVPPTGWPGSGVAYLFEPDVPEPTCFDNDEDGFGQPGDPTCPGGNPVDCDDFDALSYPGAEEICDSVDNDCNALVDDIAGLGEPCETGLPGVCAGGTFECIPPDLGCMALVPPEAEVCDGLDNNCDGAIDEGFDADVDGVADCSDNCPAVANSGQEDFNSDGSGDACQDTDSDGLLDAEEITMAGGPAGCPSPSNHDSDGDSVLDGGDPFPCDVPPTANAGIDQSIRAGDPVSLDGSASFDDNTSTESLGYAWTLSAPAGSNAVLAGANTSSPSFMAEVFGTFVAQLVVTDSVGQDSLPSGVVISTENLAPTAGAGADQLVITATLVSLDGSGSTDPENDPLAFSWTLSSAPASSVAVLTSPGTATPLFTPDVDGLYEVELVVSDLLGPSAPDLVLVTATSAETYSEIQIDAADNIVADLPPGSVTTGGNQNAFTEHLANAIKDIQKGKLEQAALNLERALQRTDGCVLRGEVDGSGQGRDWITDCSAQAEIYALLQEALDAIMP